MRDSHNLGPLERIPMGEGRSYRIGGALVAVFRARTGRVHAVQAECPHRGGPLADGLVAGDTVVCPLHGMAFDLNTGAPAREGCAALCVHRVRVSPEGELLLELPRLLERAG